MVSLREPSWKELKNWKRWFLKSRVPSSSGDVAIVSYWCFNNPVLCLAYRPWKHNWSIYQLLYNKMNIVAKLVSDLSCFFFMLTSNQWGQSTVKCVSAVWGVSTIIAPGLTTVLERETTNGSCCICVCSLLRYPGDYRMRGECV